MFYHLCAYVYIVPSIIHVFSVSATERLCLWATPSQATHDWLTADHMGLSLTHIHGALGGARGGKKCGKGSPELSEQWRVHSAGDCGGERQRWHSRRYTSHPDGDVGTWRWQTGCFSFRFSLILVSLHHIWLHCTLCSPLKFVLLWIVSWKRQMGIINGLVSWWSHSSYTLAV